MTSGAKHRVITKYTNGLLTIDEVCLVILLLVVKITYFIELIIINPVYFQKFIRKDYVISLLMHYIITIMMDVVEILEGVKIF